ncbi:MAG: CDP-diacylglycerol--serine O-phosphatidyltransferase, partial [Gammaproteobacteria bacterium]
LSGMGKLGWLVAFVYTAAAALRLARFNTQIGTADKQYFQGLASPAAAAIVAGMVWVGDLYLPADKVINMLALVLTLLAGLLMVSNIRYHSFKGFDLRGKVPFMAILLVVLILVLISYEPPMVLFGGFLVYALSGPVLTLWQLRQRRAERQQHRADSDTEEQP